MLSVATAGALVLAMSAPLFAKQRPKRQASSRPACARMVLSDESVCGTRAGEGSLPLPSSRLRSHPRDSGGLVLKDGVSIDGKTNFNENRFGEAPLHKLMPRPPSKASTNGGAQVDFQF